MADGGVPPWGEVAGGGGPEVVVEADHDVGVVHEGAEFAFIEGLWAFADEAFAETVEVVAAFRGEPLALAEETDVEGVDEGVEDGLHEPVVSGEGWGGIGALMGLGEMVLEFADDWGRVEFF